MEIVEYRIRNYKAILDTSIKLNYSIIPIIGVNEAGKTSILQAILAFDRNRDKSNDGIHLEYQNKYSTKDTKESKITATLKLKKDEILELKESLKSTLKKDALNDIVFINEEYKFTLTRELSNDSRNYYIEDENLNNEIKDKIKKYIIKKTTFYFIF